MNDDAMDMTAMETVLPGWLTPVSWIFVALGVISAALVLYDIYGRRHRQPNAAMGLVWPISALYLGPFGLWAYNRWGKNHNNTSGDGTARSEKELHGRALTGSTPGGAAATVGHFIGVPLVVASGLTIAGTNLWVLIIVIALLAIVLLRSGLRAASGAANPATSGKLGGLGAWEVGDDLALLLEPELRLDRLGGHSETAFLNIKRAHDVLDPGVVLNAIHREVLAVTGALEASMRHLGGEKNVGIDPDCAEVEVPGHPHGGAMIGGPDARRQRVLDVVGQLDRLVLGGELLHGDDRAEGFLLDNVVGLPTGPRLIQPVA